MRWFVLLAVLGLVACGDDEDCYETVRAGGKEHCVPGPNADKEMCVINPEPKGLGAACNDIRDLCPAEHLLLAIYSTDGDVLATCDCDPDVAASGVCDGSTHPL